VTSHESAGAQRTTTSAPVIAGLVLAAGESTRMGQDKPLLRYRGRTFLEHILVTLQEAGVERLAVVLGHHAEQIRRAADLTAVDVVINADYRRGQTSSLQAGLRALEPANPDAIALCLVDHPAVSAETVRRLLGAFRESLAPLVIPTYQNQRGHPVLIGKALFEELKGLGFEQGANTLIRKYRHRTQWVEVKDAGILLDVDDPNTYGRLK
jgi:molybdenum cofactor cytidylyltransferase